jgi:hypothetical protein
MKRLDKWILIKEQKVKHNLKGKNIKNIKKKSYLQFNKILGKVLKGLDQF